jgi:hypothetical protein
MIKKLINKDRRREVHPKSSISFPKRNERKISKKDIKEEEEESEEEEDEEVEKIVGEDDKMLRS